MDDSSTYRRTRRRHSSRNWDEPAREYPAQIEAPSEEHRSKRKAKTSTRKSKKAGSSHAKATVNFQNAERHPEAKGSRKWLAIRIAVIAVSAAVGYYLFGTTFAENATPRTIALMAPLIPAFLVIYLVMTLDFRPTAFFVGLYMQIFAFLFLIHLRQRDFEDFSFDWAIIAQLVVLLAGAAFVLWNAKRLLQAWPWADFISILLTAFIVLSALSLIGSPNPDYGASSMGILLNLLGIAAVLVLRLRPAEIQTILAVALLPPVVLSLVTYFTQFELTFTWGMSSDYSVPRLRGVSGTPVGMSQHCAFLGLVAIARMATAQRRRTAWIIFGVLTLPLAAYVSWLSESRSPPMAFFIAVFVSMILYFKPFGRMSLLISIVGCLAVMPIAYFVLEQGVSQTLLAGLSRSGQAAEIATLTGRVEIWTIVFDLISQKPFLGHGFGSGVIVLLEAFEGTDWIIVHAHNLAIHTAFSIGVGGAVVITLFFAVLFVRAYRVDDLMVLMIVTFLFLSNITETSVLANRPNFVTFLFLLSACRLLPLRTNEKQAGRKVTSEQKSSGRRRRSSGEKRAAAPA